MRILLINPPNCGRNIAQEKFGLEPSYKIFRGEPLSLEVLAGNLTNHETCLLDLKVPEESLSDTLTKFKPQIVGLTSLTCEANTVVALCQEIKNYNQDIMVVVGGIQASNDPAFFNQAVVDYIVIGLGKASFSHLALALERGLSKEVIPGVAKTKPGQPLSFIPRQYNTEDLAEHSAPRFDLVDKYRHHYLLPNLKLNMGLVVTAFGCPNSCSFCSIAGISAKRYLTHTEESVIRDIKLLNNIPVIRLVDANSFGNIERARKLGRAIEKADLGKHLIIDACADTIVQYPDLLHEWKQAGLRVVIIGFEEINEALLSAWKKKNTLTIIRQAIKILHDLDISIVGDFIVSPDYTEKNFQMLADFIEENKIKLPVFSVLTPLPGTPLYQSMKDKITIDDLDYYTLTNAVTPTRLPEKEFYSLFNELAARYHSKASL